MDRQPEEKQERTGRSHAAGNVVFIKEVWRRVGGGGGEHTLNQIWNLGEQSGKKTSKAAETNPAHRHRDVQGDRIIAFYKHCQREREQECVCVCVRTVTALSSSFICVSSTAGA